LDTGYLGISLVFGIMGVPRRFQYRLNGNLSGVKNSQEDIDPDKWEFFFFPGGHRSG